MGYGREFKDDAEWLASLEKVTDMRQALQILVENEGFYGYDPYYRDIREAIFRMAERVLEDSK
jgi:hypothetical protein